MTPADRSDWEAGADLIALWWRDARATRDLLPWRSERDPWRVLVAEVMLAQTQASRVAECYPAVISRMGTVNATADLSTTALVELWNGLGYYRRALSLRAAAIVIRDRFDGEMPATLDELLELPGVGQYTARAILAFSFDHEVAVIDTNIGRVLARAVAGRALSIRAAQHLADEIVGSRQPRDWNLALMDFGATLCTARAPRCDQCPVGSAGHCRWQSDGGADPATRSAATARPQTKFQGSDREGRGRLLRGALSGPILPDAIGLIAGWPDDPTRALRVAVALVKDELLATNSDGSYVLAGTKATISEGS